MPYPMNVPTPQPMAWGELPSDLTLDARDYMTTVWVGPAAPYPHKPAVIHLPRQMMVKCDWFTATDPDAIRFLTEELLARHPEIATVYLYATILPEKLSEHCTLIWKVWLH